MEINYKKSKVKVNFRRLCVRLAEVTTAAMEKNPDRPAGISVHPKGFISVSFWIKNYVDGDFNLMGVLFAEFEIEKICELLEIDSQKFINEISEDASNGSK